MVLGGGNLWKEHMITAKRCEKLKGLPSFGKKTRSASRENETIMRYGARQYFRVRALSRRCAMASVQQGDTVRIHFRGRFPDGEEFASSSGSSSAELTVGSGKVIPGIEEALVGMSEGESKTVHLPPHKAYGEKRDELMLKADRRDRPELTNLVEGQQVKFLDQQGRKIVATVAEVEGSTVTLDANHPLAGQDVVFDLELVEIV
jgi:peptidylprolyl isomerase